MKTPIIGRWGLFIAMIIFPEILLAQNEVTAWEFFCKYLANATASRINSIETHTEDFDHSLAHSAPHYVTEEFSSNISIDPNIKQYTSESIVTTVDDRSSYHRQRTQLKAFCFADISMPFYDDYSVRWNGEKWQFTATAAGPCEWMSDLDKNIRPVTSQQGSAPWQLIASKFVLRKIAGDTYTFTCASNVSNFNALKAELPHNSVKEGSISVIPIVPEIQLTIPSTALNSSDEFGRWQWNDDRSEIWVNSTGQIWGAENAKFKIIRDGNILQLALDGPEAAFGSPSSIAGGQCIYDVEISFGGAYQVLKFMKVGSSDLGCRLIYGSYNRFTGEFAADASTILNQYKYLKYCVLKCGSEMSVNSFVFPLEGLQTVMDYIN